MYTLKRDTTMCASEKARHERNFAGWQFTSGERVPEGWEHGYRLEYYFVSIGQGAYIYEGPDCEGIEPRFEEEEA